MLKSARFFSAAIFFFAALILPHSTALAFEDLTAGKPFLPWIWQDQIKPTIHEGFDCHGVAILFATSTATIVAHQSDPDARANYGDHNYMPADVSRYGDFIGAGYLSAVGSVAGLLWDQPNGLLISRAVVMTSFSHLSISSIVNRERPNHGPNSFPSGHTSTSFALAGSLAYAYGAWVGVPALALATFVGASRIADNAHWFSDTVAAAGLGLFWARASAHVAHDEGTQVRATNNDAPDGAIGRPEWTPALVPGGLTLNFSREF